MNPSPARTSRAHPSQGSPSHGHHHGHHASHSTGAPSPTAHKAHAKERAAAPNLGQVIEYIPGMSSPLQSMHMSPRPNCELRCHNGHGAHKLPTPSALPSPSHTVSIAILFLADNLTQDHRPSISRIVHQPAHRRHPLSISRASTTEIANQAISARR